MNDRRRRLSALCWLVVAAVLLRAASGGGGLASFRYVFETEARVVYAAGALLLAVALALASALGLGLARSRTLTLSRLSALVSIPTILFGVGAYLGPHGHESGLGLAAAAVGALVLAAPVVLSR